MNVTINEYNKVNSEDWLLSSALSENKYYYKVLDDYAWENIGNIEDLTYIEVTDEINRVLGRCIYIKSSSTLCSLFVYPRARGQKIATLLVKHCISKAKQEHKLLNLFTRIPSVMKICDNLGFTLVNQELGHYSEELENFYIKNS